MSKTAIFHGLAIVLIIVTVFWATREAASVTDAAAVKDLGAEGIDRKEDLKSEGIAMLKSAVAFILAGLYVAFVVIKYGLPRLTGAITDLLFSDSSAQEEVEDEVMRTARMFYAQGEYEAAAEAYAQAALKNPEDRMPIIERARVQLDKLEDPHAAIKTYEAALERPEWEANDTAFFMFRIATVYKEKLEDTEAARTMLEQIMDRFPGTQHAEQAMAKLRER